MLSIDGESLTLDLLARVAVDHEPVELAEEARRRVLASRKVIDRALDSNSPIYGVTTGFGKLSDIRIPHDEIRQLQVNLLRSHACGVGDPLPEPEVRAAILLRANSLAKGYSGVRPEIIDSLILILNRGVVPVVPSRGSVGASGDLAPSAHMALVLIGEGEALYQGERLPGSAALQRAGIAPVQLEAKEGLSLLNGTQFMAAVGGLSLVRAANLMDTADVAASLSLEVLLGSVVADDVRIHQVRPHPGQQKTAANISRMLRNSAIVESHKDCGRLQDAYSLRCVPQVHGAVRDALVHVAEVLTGEILAACQAMEFRKPLQPGEGTRKAYALVRQVIAPLENDREISPDIQTLRDLIRHNRFAELV
jgi:histidine ammonia-lyase